MQEQAFQARISRAEKFEEAIHEALYDMGFIVSRIGMEHILDATHKSALHNAEDRTSRMIRNNPDFIATIGYPARSVYVEAKSGKSIERDAWHLYKRLTANGEKMVVVFNLRGDWMWNSIGNIVLESGEDSVARFPEEKRQPVQNGWIVPAPGFSIDNPQASGTPFRYVDKSSLLPWSAFEERVIKMMN